MTTGLYNLIYEEIRDHIGYADDHDCRAATAAIAGALRRAGYTLDAAGADTGHEVERLEAELAMARELLVRYGAAVAHQLRDALDAAGADTGHDEEDDEPPLTPIRLKPLETPDADW